ncbi:MAG: GNAT family N-acetyltransferase [Kineosporiaceae bacterium]
MQITREDGYQLDDDHARLDVDRIHRWLAEESYWALGRPREKVAASLANSLVVGAYAPDGGQVGISRVVTDLATFAWLADVFVATDHRGRGLGRAMVAAHLDRLRPLGVRRVLLATTDAHGVYAGLGFAPQPEPHKLMELRLDGGTP